MSEAEVSVPAAKLGILKSIVIGAAGLFYAYGVWNAVAYCLRMAQEGLNAYGVFLMVFAIAMPIIVFVIAFSFRMRLTTPGLIVVMLAGLGIVAAFWMNVVGYTALNLQMFLLA